MAAPKQTDPQFKLRMTPEIKDRIEKAAAANNRSMNAEILARLEKTLDGSFEKNLLEYAMKAAEERGRRDVAFESFQLAVGIISEASGNDKRTIELLAKAIREGTSGEPDPLSKTRHEAVERLAEMIKTPR